MINKLRKLISDTSPVRLAWHRAWGVAGNVFLPVDKDLKIIFVTGTKGKTTTAWSLGTLLHESGESVAVCTTALFRIGKKTYANETKMTTLGRFGLRKFLRKARKASCTVAVVEASSQAYVQSRLHGLRGIGYVWTNIQEDHLEYHGGKANYINAKIGIMNNVKKNGFVVLNGGDPECSKFADFAQKRNLKISEIEATKIKSVGDKLKFKSGKEDFEINFSGNFNAQNLAEVIEAGRGYGLTAAQIKKVLPKIYPVPGRLQYIQNDHNLHIYIDFSYTPKALSEAITAVRGKHGKSKLWVMTGATGGGRDTRKFPLMGESASAADYVVLTDDDLGTEDNNLAILDQIKTGFPEGFTDYEIIPQREKAVRHIITNAKRGDIILLAGKGCETVQHYGTRQRPYSELTEVKKSLKKRKP